MVLAHSHVSLCGKVSTGVQEPELVFLVYLGGRDSEKQSMAPSRKGTVPTNTPNGPREQSGQRWGSLSEALAQLWILRTKGELGTGSVTW